MPRGLYVDEASIGLNAASIAESLRDEHGVFLPVYFEAFGGEYKNPLYIYTVAVFFKVFGISAWNLRAVSVFYFGVLLAGVAILTWRSFPRNYAAVCYAVIATGSMPWIFTLSRISFEVISQPAVWIWTLFVISWAYCSANVEPDWRVPTLSGFLAALSVYTYTTSRLLTFTLVATLLGVYWSRRYWRRHARFIAGFAIGLIPYVAFSMSHPGALTERFRAYSYFYLTQLSLSDKIWELLQHYLDYFRPDFLIWRGDQNLRHNIGGHGQLLIVMAALAVVGAALHCRGRGFGDRRFGLLLILNCAISAVPAALIDSNHGLRSLLMGVYALLFSIAAFAALSNPAGDTVWRRTMAATVCALLMWEASSYVREYFQSYPTKSIRAFESYDFPSVLREVIVRQPAQVIVSRHSNQPYAHLEFSRYLVDNPRKIPLSIGEPVAQHQTCVVYFSPTRAVPNPGGYRVVYDAGHDLVRTTCFE